MTISRVTLALLSILCAAFGHGTQPGSKLLKHDRSRLCEARAQGNAEATLLIASVPGTNEAVAREVLRLGGAIRYRADDVSYLRVMAPIARVEEIAQSVNVQTLNLDGYPDYYSGGSLEGPLTEMGQEMEMEIAPPGPGTPPENPYLPTRDIGAPQFVKEHPTFDGRGVTIAIVEAIPDLLSPELQTATTLEGKTTPKIAEIYSTVDPLDDDDIYRVKMRDEVTARDGGHFNYKNILYTVPADGVYRVGIFDATPRPALNTLFPFTYFGYFNNIHLTASPQNRGAKDRDKLFAVLWDESSNMVWVDTNQNDSFADEKAMTDYNVRKDFGVFGKDNPTTPTRDTMAFTVFTSQQHKYITIGATTNTHTAGVASSAAGKGFFGGRLNGSAPESQLLIVAPNTLKTYSPIEGMILAIRNPKVDLATMSWGTVMRLNDGNSVLDVVFDRLIEKYKKPIFIGASNGGPAINTVFNSTGKVMIVGGYTHRDTWRANYGIIANKIDYVNNISSRGPREDGGFKPDILAPVDSLMSSNALFSGSTLGRAYKLPPGYQQSHGTSFAGPMAAGGAALLISAAKQSGVPYDAERIRWAIKSSARYLPGFGAHEQGAGLLDIRAAWEALKKAPVPIEITSRAPVNTVLSRYLKEPNRGPGIYEREGWMAGQTGQREVSFTRTSGDAEPVVYAVRWVGNDGTYNSPGTISLPLNRPIALPVVINPKTAGVHSALLELVDRTRSYPVYQTMCTVVAAEQFTAPGNFTIKHEGQAEFPGWASYFFYVPAGASVFKVDMQVSSGNVKLNFFDPSGTSYLTSHPRLPGQGLVDYQEGGSWSRAFAKPEPGVWEVIIINDNTRRDGIHLYPQLPATFALSASILSIEFSKTEFLANTGQIDLTNRGGTFTGGIASASLGSAFSDRPTLKSNGSSRLYKIYEINVPDGAASLEVTIGKASDREADLDLYLYDCTGNKCITAAHSVGSTAEESVAVNNPKAGTWKVIIDPFYIPSGQTNVDYQDIFTHSKFGTLTSAGAPALREPGGRWAEKLHTKVEAIPARGRYLASVLKVIDANVNCVNYRIDVKTGKREAPRLTPAPLNTIIQKMH
jgi:Subtilase family/Bacterial pre-peptidase C-terminal domain